TPHTPAPSPLALHDALPISRLDRRARERVEGPREGRPTVAPDRPAGGDEEVRPARRGRLVRHRPGPGRRRRPPRRRPPPQLVTRSEEHTSELQSQSHLVCRL